MPQSKVDHAPSGHNRCDHHPGRPTGSHPRAVLVIVAIALALALALASGGCTAAVPPVGGEPGGAGRPPKDLGAVEVREYKGERLDAISDFRENSIEGPQYVDRVTYRLKVDGAVTHPAIYTYAQVLTEEATHTKVVQLNCVEGWSVKILWEGVLLSDLIDRASPKPGGNTLIFHAADGYTTSMPLAYARERRILLAYKMNTLEIPPERGFPFMVVAEDKWGYKWCKWVTRIEISDDEAYRGYWESRGYSRDGDLRKPSFGQ
jgi:DMSO/TMAO reductase YedYZ molybdopterin-dependent catalytic subunit